MTYPSPPAAPGLELGAHDDAYTTDRDPTATMLSAETDAMRLEATALDIPDTLEGLLTFALREIAALRIAGRVLRADIEGCRTEAVGLHSEVARLKLRVKGLEGEL